MTLDPTLITLLKSASRASVYLATALIVGAAVFDAVVLWRVRAGHRHHAIVMRTSTRAIGLAAAATLLVAYAVRLYIQVIDSYLVVVPTLDMLRALIFSTRGWGLGVLAQMGLALFAAVLFIAARRHPGPRPLLLSAAALMAAIAVPLTGHAVAHGGPLAVVVQATHVAAVGAWLGTLAMVWTVSRRSPTASLAATVQAFSPVALTAAAALVVAGIAALFVHVGTPNDLFSTRYGRTLLVKVALFWAAAAVGFVNWRVMTFRLSQPGQRAGFSRLVAVELALGVVAILVTTLLTDLPRPGEE